MLFGQEPSIVHIRGVSSRIHHSQKRRSAIRTTRRDRPFTKLASGEPHVAPRVWRAPAARLESAGTAAGTVLRFIHPSIRSSTVMETFRSSIRRSFLLAVAPTGFPAPVVPPGLGSKNHPKHRPTVGDATILRRAVEHARLVGGQASRGLGAVAAIRSM